MRKILCSFITGFFIIFIISCTKTKTDQVQLNSAIQLTTDSNFIQLLKTQISLGDFLKNATINSGYSIEELKNKALYIKNQKLTMNEEKNQIEKLLGEGANNYIKSYDDDFKKSWDKLNQKYNNISVNKIEEAFNIIFSQKEGINILPSKQQKIATNSTTKVSKVDGCGYKYYLCIAAATSTAILCHAACITGTAGLGAPACVVLCGSIQVSAGIYCNDTYCPIN